LGPQGHQTIYSRSQGRDLSRWTPLPLSTLIYPTWEHIQLLSCMSAPYLHQTNCKLPVLRAAYVNNEIDSFSFGLKSFYNLTELKSQLSSNSELWAEFWVEIFKMFITSGPGGKWLFVMSYKFSNEII
jgi:hypothetical protein